MVGNFARYPFNILSQLSILTGSLAMPEYLFMASQLTAFNLDDENLEPVWKRLPSIKTAAHFTKHIERKTLTSQKSNGGATATYGRVRNFPGAELSYGVYPVIHEDDYYYGQWEGKNANQKYLVSGRDILLASSTHTREETEDLIRMERNDLIDDLSSIGWTVAVDSSGYLLEQPTLDTSEAKLLAINDLKSRDQDPHVHDGNVED